MRRGRGIGGLEIDQYLVTCVSIREKVLGDVERSLVPDAPPVMRTILPLSGKSIEDILQLVALLKFFMQLDYEGNRILFKPNNGGSVSLSKR